MNKKIQISTVKQTADVQVINLNAYFVAKAIKASLALNSENILRLRQPKYERTEDGVKILDENNKPIVVKDENGNNQYNYRFSSLGVPEVDALFDVVKPFVDELVEAFEE